MRLLASAFTIVFVWTGPKPWLQESRKAAQSLVTPQPSYLSARPGFYLGYLRGRSFPPPPPKKNIVIITVFLNY